MSVCYSVVTVLLQCCYSVVTVLLQCCYSVVTVLLQCCYSVVTVLFQRKAVVFDRFSNMCACVRACVCVYMLGCVSVCVRVCVCARLVGVVHAIDGEQETEGVTKV
jgi:hypothetical protein